MARKALWILAYLLAMPLALATPAMLATNISYADILVASAAANKIGAEVYWVGSNAIPEEIYSALAEIKPEEIYIIGGPAVVSEKVEENLSEKYNVTRIWGMTRYGTAAEVAKYFWAEGAEKAVLAVDLPDSPEVNEKYAELVEKAKDIAISEQIPLLLIPSDSLPSETEDALTALGVKSVYLVGEASEKVKEALENLGIAVEREMKTREEAEEVALNRSRKLVIVAVDGWKDAILVPYVPRGAVILVRSEEKIPKVVEKVSELVNEGRIDEVKVVGIPWKAKAICDALSKAGIEHECLTGKRVQLVKKVMEKYREKIREIRKKYLKLKIKAKQFLEKHKEEIKNSCEDLYEKGKSIAESMEEVPETVSARLTLLEALKKDCANAVESGAYLKAVKIANEMQHHVRLMLWRHRSEFGEDLQEEILSETKPREAVKTRAIAIKRKLEELQSKIKDLSPACREELRTASQLLSKGEIRRAMIHMRIAKMICEKSKIEKLREMARKRKAKVCIQVLTPAVNPQTGECRVFPTPCDVPEGWKIVKSCKTTKEFVKKRIEECKKLVAELRKARNEGNENKAREIMEEIKRKCRVFPLEQAFCNLAKISIEKATYSPKDNSLSIIIKNTGAVPLKKISFEVTVVGQHGIKTTKKYMLDIGMGEMKKSRSEIFQNPWEYRDMLE